MPIVDTAKPLPGRPGAYVVPTCTSGVYLNSMTAATADQTMGHIVDSCPLTLLNDGLARLHEADDDAVNWLKTTEATVLAK